MASRLSEETLKAVLDGGYKGLSWDADIVKELTGAPVDLDKILFQEKPEKAVQALQPQLLYKSLYHAGLESCIEVLPLLSSDQVTKIFDYDIWTEDRLAPAQAFKWLTLFKSVNDAELFKRFAELDEEYQIALLGPFINILDEEEYETLPDVEQDKFTVLPCNTLYYRVLSEDPVEVNFIDSLVKAALSENIAYAYHLLACAAYMPPNEQEHLISQFRQARLEEDGFVTYEESRRLFLPFDADTAKAKWNSSRTDRDGLIPLAETAETMFLKRVQSYVLKQGWDAQKSEAITLSFVHLGNMVCSAAKVTPDDLHGIQSVMRQVHSLSSLGLEYLAENDVELGARILAEEHCQILFRTGLALVSKLQNAFLVNTEQYGLEGAGELKKLNETIKKGEVLHFLDTEYLDILGFQRTEMLKGLFNRFPMSPSTVTDDSEAPRIVFRPFESMKALELGGAEVNVLSALLFLAHKANVDNNSVINLDACLMNSFVNLTMQKQFLFADVSADDRENFLKLDESAIRSRVSDFLGEIENILRSNLSSSSSWRVCVAGAAEEDTKKVLRELEDVLNTLCQLNGSSGEGGAFPVGMIFDVGENPGLEEDD